MGALSAPALGAGKKYTNLVALGLSNINIDNTTGTVTFTLNDGSSASFTFPVPADGVSVVDSVSVDDTHFKWKFSDGSYSDDIEYPKQLIEISSESGNAIVKKADGLYVATSSVQISAKADNAIVSESDGLYVKLVDDVKVSTDTDNAIEKRSNGIYVKKLDTLVIMKTDIADDLETDSEEKVLSAKQGKILDEGKINKIDIVDDLTSTSDKKVLSANQGKVLDEKISALDASAIKMDSLAPTSKTIKEKLDDKFENKTEVTNEGKYVRADSSGNLVFEKREEFINNAEYEALATKEANVIYFVK